MQPSRPVVGYIAGVCEPNPGGHAVVAWVALAKDATVVAKEYRYLGCGMEHSNNTTAYEALLRFLGEEVGPNQWQNLPIRTHHKLLVDQLTGVVGCNSPQLQPLLERATQSCLDLGVHLSWVPREQNVRAAELARKAAAWLLRERGLPQAVRQR